MKKIAILTCLQANDVCAGCSCLRAMNERIGHFALYRGEELELAAFMRCSQCGIDPREHKGMMEKMERLVKEGVQTVHIGICTQRRDGTTCPWMQQCATWLEAQGLEIVWGTHG